MKLSKQFEKQKAIFMRIELGIEVYYQAASQVILLLLAQTETATTGGLESLFGRKSSIMGIEMYPETILILSIAWSLKSLYNYS